MDDPSSDADPVMHRRNLLWGALFVVAGVWWFLHQNGLVPFDWNWAGPVALVAVGVSMLFTRRMPC